MFCVVTTKPGQQGRFFRLPTDADLDAVQKAARELERKKAEHKGPLSLVPDESLPLMSGVFNAPIYGHTTWGSLFASRQALTLVCLVSLTRQVQTQIRGTEEPVFVQAVITILALAVSRLADISNSLCNWSINSVQAVHLFGRQAIPMMWDFAETSFLSDAAGDIGTTTNNMIRILEREMNAYDPGQILQANAASHPLPDDSSSLFFTDPPYYNAVPYADLSDFFYVWLHRMLIDMHDTLFAKSFSPKDDEICEMVGWDPVRFAFKDRVFFES
jgi:adenine-specific DNA methylase